MVTIINQYFPELINKFEGLTDLRHQSYVIYKMKVIFMVRLLALMCEIKTMHEMTREFDTQEAFVTGLDYQENKTNIIKYKDNKKGTEFVYMTDLSITNKNIEETIYLGRKRWKIENEGFNIQKNRTFNIGHLYSKDSTAIKIHYLMIQIAHIIRQLLERGVKEIKELGLKLKEISQHIKKELISTISNLTTHKKMQLRFD